jgi:hypothetical protein
MAATSIDLSQIKTDALDTKATFKTLIEAEGVVESIVAGTGITVDDTDPANPIVTATGGSVSLTTVSITDAAVSMVANTRYEGSIAAFTEDRTYTLPAGTAGDVVEVALTTGDDAFELIIAGASGVSINGGSAATEWSRLFIDNEFVRFRCIATNDWRVEIDGRIQCYARTTQGDTTASANAWNKFALGTLAEQRGDCVSGGEFLHRRVNSGLILTLFSRFVTSATDRSLRFTSGTAANSNIVSESQAPISNIASFGPAAFSNAELKCVSTHLQVAAGHTIKAWYYYSSASTLTGVEATYLEQLR